jgi:hypothetical protein
MPDGAGRVTPDPAASVRPSRLAPGRWPSRRGAAGPVGALPRLGRPDSSGLVGPAGAVGRAVLGEPVGPTSGPGRSNPSDRCGILSVRVVGVAGRTVAVKAPTLSVGCLSAVEMRH